MKISIILLSIAIIAMSIENCTSKNLLVDIDNVDESNRVPTEEGKFYLFWTYTTDGEDCCFR